jgi:NADH-quinone oxidoreductase subunit N
VLATLVIAAGAAAACWFLLPVPEGRATVALWTFVIGVGAMLVLRAVALVGSFALGTRGGALSSPSNVVLMLGLAVGLALAIHDTWGACCGGAPIKRVELFGNLLVYDGLTTYFRTFLLAFTVLFAVVTWCTGIPDREDGPDFYTLALGSVLGMCLMASANHLLIVFLGLEMASVPSYALAGMLKGRRDSSEAALKFAVYGAGAAGIMLYGISLIAGLVGSVHLPTMATKLAELLASSPPSGTVMVLALAGLMIMVGLAFKLSAVPFHFWAPDVFEGAAAEIGGFLSVASKGAAIALLLRVALGFSAPVESSPSDTRPVVAQAGQAGEGSEAGKKAADTNDAEDAAAKVTPVARTADTPVLKTIAERRDALQPARAFIVNLITLIAAITATFGNLAAYGQTNMKRLLAYSTIAHAGYMMMPVAAVVALAGTDAVKAQQAVGSVAFYVAMYLFMNLGAFTIVALLRNQLRSEQIDDYSGLVQRNPGLVVCFSAILFSLVGLPPLVGFMAKFAIFAALVDAQMYLLLTIGVLNSVLSLFYYLRVIKVMVLGVEPARRPAVRMPLATSLSGLCVLLLSLPVLGFGIYWNGVYEWAVHAAAGLIAP